MGVPASHALAFVAGTSRDAEQQAAMLAPLLAQLGLPTDLGLTAFRAMRLRGPAWVALGARLVRDASEARIAHEDLDEVRLAAERAAARRGASLLSRLAALAAGEAELACADMEHATAALRSASQSDSSARVERMRRGSGCASMTSAEATVRSRLLQPMMPATSGSTARLPWRRQRAMAHRQGAVTPYSPTSSLHSTMSSDGASAGGSRAHSMAAHTARA
mmetsp:Transcript_23200/g.62882  ORF Transcript_23200/g.62882 Transcript_23200/m.62882 type:complete len:220 (+) Transcript_23200:1025-1684(+)